MIKSVLGLAALSVAAPAFAQTPYKAPPKAFVDVTAQEMAAGPLLPPPPADKSPRALAELAQVRETIAAATPARLAQARWDDDHEDPTLFAPTLGPAFDLAKLPATDGLLRLVQGNADASASAAKKVFNRRRPWAVDPAIKTCDPDDKPLTSYPSGHSTIGYSLAMTLALVLPERAPQVLARASDYAFSRVICGSHYASDTQASQALAAVLVTRLSINPDFQAKLAAAKRELTGKF